MARWLAALVVLAIAALTLTACGGDETASVTTTVTEAQSVATTEDPSNGTQTTFSGIPPDPVEVVKIDSIRDERIRGALRTADPNATEAVKLAPGVYAELGEGPVGTRADYTSVVGLCADMNQYLGKYPVGGSCF